MNAEERRFAREQAADFRAIDALLARQAQEGRSVKAPRAPRAEKAEKAEKVQPEVPVEPPAPVVVRPKRGRPVRLGKDDPKRDENPNLQTRVGAGADRSAARVRSRYMPPLAEAPPSPERVHVRIVVNNAVRGTIAIEHLLAPLDQFIPVTWDDGQGITSARRGILEVDE